MTNENPNKALWTRARSLGKTKNDPELIGRRLSNFWLNEPVPVLNVRLSGDLSKAFADLHEAARNIRKKLPITALRVALCGVIDRVISIDTDLGLSDSTAPAAISLLLPALEERDNVRTAIIRQLKLWMMNTVEPWAQNNDLGEIGSRIKPLIIPENLAMFEESCPLIYKNGSPDFGLIARVLGEKLIGEELFPGLGACELIASPDGRHNKIELMTLPAGLAQGDHVFSMVCRLTVCSIPYSQGVYMGVAAMKRVWANRVPPAAFRMPSRVSGYVIAAGRPAIMVPVERRDGAWEFSDGYAALRVESGNALPENLSRAIEQREFNQQALWWAGLPELKTLFRRVSPSTVFEADEVHLLNTVSSLLMPVLEPRLIQIREVSMVRFQSKLKQEMLRIEDLDGAAGDSLVLDGIPDPLDDAEEEAEQLEEVPDNRRDKLLLYREQNKHALAKTGSTAPRLLWVMGGTADEQSLIKKSVTALFGDAILVNTEPLPAGTHGLKADLDAPDGTAKIRFEQRVQRWHAATKTIQAVSKENQILTLICAPDKIGNRPEDPVNYFAGIHAMSSIGANVHHVLPMENPEDPKSRQSFLHRTQSALLDVFLAHSGVVLGVRQFLEKLYKPTTMPAIIYGIQAMRSRARFKSGQTGVNFLLYSRLIVDTGMTEIQVVYKSKGANFRSDWMPLARGLQWVGTQRHLHEGDENWLKNNFIDETRNTLLSAMTSDSRAVVMIDWTSVSGLWKGLRDFDLNSGSAKLGDIPLSTFGALSFLRLRRGSDTLSLRIASNTTFVNSAGETLVDSYYTTTKTLVEISEEKHSPASSHFIATMGYAKTVQHKRGFSCFRPMPRVKRIDKNSSDFAQITLQPAYIDAALPSSMDITVVQAPDDVDNEILAMTVMGLRLGYAHYNDWTTLPAPLFFRRKIEDYIIRFPEDEEEALITVEDENTDVSITGTQLELLYNEDELDTLQSDPQPILVTEVSPEAEENEDPFELIGETQPDENDLLIRARAINLRLIIDHSTGGNKVLYKRMFRDLPNELQVQVTLPYWVKSTDLFGAYSPTIRRMSSRIWDALRDLDYVKKSGIAKPKDADLLNWLSAHLRTPQAIHAILSVTRDINRVQFQPLSTIIREEYNAEIEDKEQHIDPAKITIAEQLLDVSVWANKQDHDVLSGWLVFLAAQLGVKELADIVLSSLTHIPGPRTEDALDYYIQCAQAAEEVLTKGLGVKNIYRHRPLHPAAEAEKSNSENKTVFMSAPLENISAQPDPIQHSQQQQEGDSIMAMKNKLINLIQHLSPGADDFDENMAAVNGVLEEILITHRVVIEQLSTKSLIRDGMEALQSNCETLIAVLKDVQASLELNQFIYVEPNESILSTCVDQINVIRILLDDFKSLNRVLESLNGMPASNSVAERARRNAKESETLTALLRVGDDIKSNLFACDCLFEDTVTPPDEHKPLPVAEPVQQPIELIQSTNQSVVVETPVAQVEIARSSPIVIEQGKQVEVDVPVPFPAILEPIKSVVLPVVISHVEIEVKDDISPDDTDLFEIDKQLGTLNSLLHKRYYGLAQVQVEALKHLFNDVTGSSIKSHDVVLNALVSSLYAMDCHFDFESRIDQDLYNLLRTEDIPAGKLCDPAIAALGVLAASFASMLFATQDVQGTISYSIKSRLLGHAALSALIHHIIEISQQGLVITRDMYLQSHISEKSAIEVELNRFKKRAGEWRTGQDIFSNWNHRGFRRLHEEIFSNRNSLGMCISLIAKGDAAKVLDFYESELRVKLKKPAQVIDEAYKKIGERTQPDGLYRDRAIENIETSKRFIESYLEHVKRRENSNIDLNRNIQQYLKGLHKLLMDSVSEIGTIETKTDLERLYKDAALVALDSGLKLFENTLSPMCIPQEKQKLLVQLPLNRDLMPTLDPIDFKTPAIVKPSEVFHETARWVDEKLRMDASNDGIDAALKDAMRVHIDKKRFMPAWRIAKMINATDTLIKFFNDEKKEFKARLQESKQRVTHAMTLSALQQNEASSMQRIIDKLLTSNEGAFGIGHPDGDPSTYADFPQAKAALNFNVTNPLNDRLEQAATQLTKNLDDYIEQHGLDSSGDVKRIKAIIGDGHNAANLRTAFDAMTMLNANGKLPKRLGQPDDMATQYDNFMSKVHTDIGNNKFPLDSLRDRLKQAPHSGDPDWLSKLDSQGRDDAVELIDSWVDMFDKGVDKREYRSLSRVLHILGISSEPNVVPDSMRQNRVKFTLSDRAFTFPNTHEDDVFIPPVLGSAANHIEGFLVNGMPQENDLRAHLISISTSPTLVMSRNHFNMQKRARICANLPVLLIDDDLIAFVALHPTERLQSLMRVSILTFSSNPYDDYGGRPVPTEMFFGRQKELSRLRDVKSVGILYGGRRLGKSSLLSQIVQESKNIPGSAAVYISMDTVQANSEYLDSAWEYLYSALVNQNVIQPKPNSKLGDHKSIKDWIEKEITSRQDLKSLYLLIDEADTLMGCELRNSNRETSFVNQLVHLIDSVHTCKVRYVIAGLHNITRMASEENSVFGKAEPIALEPFNTPDDFQRGISLITKPMAAMGFIFAEDKQDLPLRILSVCNFYPAFIQLYCKCLVDRLQNNRQSNKPPLNITEADLDAIEHDDTLLSELRNKFELNLNLDKRYKAIALILADVYYSDIEKGQYNGLSVPEIRDYCESFCGKHFEHTGAGAYESLLDEMVKLNVLERSQGSRYQLRNPNIAIMMGDRERVSSKIDELSREKPNESRDHGDRRVTMTYRNSSSATFPMPIGWVRNQTGLARNQSTQSSSMEDGELIVLAGSRMSGLDDAVTRIDREEWQLGNSVVVSNLRGNGPEEANALLSQGRRVGPTANIRRLLLVRPNAWKIRQIGEFANVASRGARSGIRIALVAPPERAFELATELDAGNIKTGMIDDQRGWSVVPVPTWSEDAIFFRMSENVEVSQNSDAIRAILAATCGFDSAVNKLCSNKLKVSDALNSPKDFGATYASTLKDLYEHVGLPASFTDDRRRVMETFLLDVEGVVRNSLTCEELRKKYGVTQGEMDFMYWMGLLQHGLNGTWLIPPLYLNLLLDRA